VTATGLRRRPRAGLSHEAYLYRTTEEYVAGCAAFLRTGLYAGEAALVSVPAAKHDRLRDALGSAAAQVQFADMTMVGRNPARIIPFVNRFAQTHAGTRVSFIGEPIWPGRTPAETREAVRHEALLNVAFDAVDITIFCPYDAAGLDPGVIADSWRTHPQVCRHDGWHDSGDYAEPAALFTAADRPLPAPPPTALILRFRVEDLPLIRRLVGEAAARWGISAGRAADFVVAVNEVATNSVGHAPPGGQLRLWTNRRHKALICEIRDAGHITDPLAGRRMPGPDAATGRGLWLANQYCDLVELRSDPDGTTVRMYVRR
jgi:anti-sigma regulatory factor (Ser/Thr protein kinase)